MKNKLLALGILATTALSCNKTQTEMETPKTEKDFPAVTMAEKKPQTFNEHGYARVDDYFWLKDKTNPEVIKYLEAENAYSEAVMAPTKAFQETLYKEMRRRIKEADQTVPYKDNGYLYYTRTEEGKQYSISCRKKGSIDAKEEILIDGNKMAEGQKAYIYGGGTVSPDNKLFGYQSNFTGSYAEYDFALKNLETGEMLPDFIKNCSGFEFSNDSKAIYYTIPNKALRSYRLYKHIIGSKAKDELLMEEKDEMFNLYIGKTKTQKYLIIYAGSFTTSEIKLLDLTDPAAKIKVFMPRKKDVEYSVDHHTTGFFVTYKDDNNKNTKLMLAPLAGYEDMKTWVEVIPHNSKEKLEGIDISKDFVSYSVRTNGLRVIRTYDIATKKITNVDFPEPVYVVGKSGNPEFNDNTFRYTYQSLNRPRTVYEYNMDTKKTEKLKEQEIPSGFKAEEYEVKRIFATAKDGTKVPMAIVYKKGIDLNGKNPTLLYSYGSYGSNTEPAFDANVFSLVNRGFVYAIAQIRGGSEMGEEWYEQGKLQNKMNTFTDFIACAEELVKQKYTSADYLAINGGSAGGLLMGAVTNLRPDLFKVVVAEVPFVDVINTMLDSSLPLTTQEYEQWGNPNVKAEYDYMMTYSPYDNIKAGVNFPNILATGGLNDSQVLFHEPTKYVAKLRANKKGDNVIMLKTNMESGHGGATGRFDYLKEEAFRYSFIMNRIGVKLQ